MINNIILWFYLAKLFILMSKYFEKHQVYAIKRELKFNILLHFPYSFSKVQQENTFEGNIN